MCESVIDKVCYVAHTQIYAADYLDLCNKNIMKNVQGNGIQLVFVYT